MPETGQTLPTDWLRQSDLDLQAATILLQHDGPLPVIAFHLQQAIEKRLKGYLLSAGWPLRRIHDLEVLVQEAIARDADFAPFLEPCQRITEYYVETRYPTGVHSSLEQERLLADLAMCRALAALIQRKLLPDRAA